MSRCKNIKDDKLYANAKKEMFNYFDQALVPLEKAYTIEPKNAEMLNVLATIHAQIGNYEKSTKYRKDLQEWFGQ